MLHHDGDVAEFIDEPSGQRRNQTLADFRVAGHAHQFFDLLRRGQQIEPSLAPKHDKMSEQRCIHEQRADQDVGIDDQPHASFGLGDMRLARGGNGFVDH